MFIDHVDLQIQAGKGGDGMNHFHREKFVTRGGPDGGDGGHGGSVILKVDRSLNTLHRFRRKRDFHAQDGDRGSINNRTGKSGADLIIAIPPGTIVRELSTNRLIGDLTLPDQTLLIARGGRGGRGNPHFATASNQAPSLAEKGAPGDAIELHLELKLLADIGLVGAPNAGKSSYLAAVTAAQPKIAAYPFTTLEPNLGVAALDGYDTVVLADIPGLIEGAHLGVGLGFEFLRHVQRTRVLIHLLDGAGENPLADLSQTNSELAMFDSDLALKPQIVAVNKMDLPEARERWDSLQAELKHRGMDAYPISAMSREGVRDVLFRAMKLLRELPDVPIVEREIPVYRPPEDLEAFTIEREREGYWRVRGARIERAALMTFWEMDEAVARFQKILEITGVYKALKKAGIQPGDMVCIGENELEWHD
jgi:GTPase